MDVATKRAVYAWAVIALVCEAVLMARGWPALLSAAAVAGLASAAASTWDRRTVGLVLLFTYLTPAIVWVVHGDTHPFLSIIWFAAVLGALMPDGVRGGWSIPPPWRTATPMKKNAPSLRRASKLHAARQRRLRLGLSTAIPTYLQR